VERVVVTAQRRKEQNIKVPIAVTSISGDKAKNLTTNYLADLSSKIPSVQMSMSDGASISPSINIRGLSSQSDINAGFPPAVGVYVDEVYQGRDPMFNTILNDIDRVEILRGPQGTLYGKNIIGGAINIATRLPTDEFEALGDLTFGNLGLLQLRGTVSGPIADGTVGVRLSATHRERDGFLTNTVTGEDLNDSEANGGRIVVVSDLNDDVSLQLRADYFKENGTSALETGPATLAAFPALSNQNPNDNVVALDASEFAERELYGMSGRFDWSLGFADFTSITAYRQYRSDFHDDSDGLPIDAFDVGREENAENFSQEFRLTSSDEGPVTWITGFYYYVENIENNRQIRVGPMFDSVFLGADFGPFYPGEAGRTKSTIDSSSWAFFGAATWEIVERVRLAGGLRFTHEEKDFFYHQFHTLKIPGLLPVPPFPADSFVSIFAVPIGPVFETYEDEQWTGDVSLSFDLTPDDVVFAKYSTGFKAGGFQTDVISFPFAPGSPLGFLPEFVTNYELGYKSYWFDDKLSLNLAAYYLEWEDKQEQIFTGLAFLIRNAANATSRGFEAELAARPTDWLTLDANLAYLNAKYEEFPTSPASEGKTFPGLPEFAGSVGAQIDTPIFNDTAFFARADLIFRGESYTDTTNVLKSGSSTTLNLRMGLQEQEGDWGIFLWGRNVTDEVTIGGAQTFPFPASTIVTRSPGLGRTYGIELRKAL
jgi:iron complex outermembrane receptor protein